jgi:hypothetical protein
MWSACLSQLIKSNMHATTHFSQNFDCYFVPGWMFLAGNFQASNNGMHWYEVFYFLHMLASRLVLKFPVHAWSTQRVVGLNIGQEMLISYFRCVASQLIKQLDNYTPIMWVNKLFFFLACAW